MRFQEARDVERITAGTHDDVIADDDGRGSGEVLLLHISDFGVPALFAGFGIERDQVVIRRFEEKPIAIHANAAVTDVNAAASSPKIMPNFLPGTGIDSRMCYRE